jgi:hypothetical protein
MTAIVMHDKENSLWETDLALLVLHQHETVLCRRELGHSVFSTPVPPRLACGTGTQFDDFHARLQN